MYVENEFQEQPEPVRVSVAEAVQAAGPLGPVPPVKLSNVFRWNDSFCEEAALLVLQKRTDVEPVQPWSSPVKPLTVWPTTWLAPVVRSALTTELKVATPLVQAVAHTIVSSSTTEGSSAGLYGLTLFRSCVGTVAFVVRYQPNCRPVTSSEVKGLAE